MKGALIVILKFSGSILLFKKQHVKKYGLEGGFKVKGASRGLEGGLRRA